MPFAQAPVTEKPGSSATRRCKRSRAGCSSSTIRTLKGTPSASVFIRSYGKRIVTRYSPSGCSTSSAPAAAVRELQPLADVLEREPVARALDRVVARRRDRVRDDDLDTAVRHSTADGDRPAVLERLDAVVDRVLEQRLNGEARHERAHRQLGDIPAHFEALAKPHFLDPLIDPRELELLLEAQRAMRVAQRRAEQIGEILDGLFGTLGSLRVSAAIVFKLLNRKCGRILACSASMRDRASARTWLCH